MTRRRVRLTDVSLTDGQAVVWAGGMTTPMVGALARQMAAAKPSAIEVCSPATMRQCVARGEDPWQRIDLVRARCPGLALRAVLGLVTDHGKRGADLISQDLAVQWLRQLAQHGVGEVLVIDPWLDMQRVGPLLSEATRLGMAPTVALHFSADIGLTDTILCEQAAAAASGGAARVMLRDESGVMTPDRLATLLPALRQALGATPLDLHLGCQTGLGPLVALEAVRLGVDGLDTAFAPLANGASLPSLGNLVKSSRLLGLDTAVDGVSLPAIDAVNDELVAFAERHGFPAATPWAFTLQTYVHQLPGAVAADFIARVDALACSPKLGAFAEECARIRGELGQPAMVAPFARSIAEQAWLHLQGLPRYAELRPGVRRIVQQVYGSTPGAIDIGLARRVGRIAKPRPLPLKTLRVRHPRATDASLLLSQVCGVHPMSLPSPDATDALFYVATTPADALVEGLAARAARFGQIKVSGPGLALEMRAAEGADHV